MIEWVPTFFLGMAVGIAIGVLIPYAKRGMSEDKKRK